MISHGEFSVVLTGSIIESKLAGSFNELGCSGYINAVKDKLNILAGKPFAMLIDDLELEGGTPEAYQLLNEYNQWMSKQPIVAKAFIISSQVQKDIILQRSPSLLQQNIEFFTDREHAMLWLHGEIASIS